MQDFTQPNPANNQMPVNSAIPGSSGVPPMPVAAVPTPVPVENLPESVMPPVQPDLQQNIQPSINQQVVQPISQQVEQPAIVSQPVVQTPINPQPVQPQVVAPVTPVDAQQPVQMGSQPVAQQAPVTSQQPDQQVMQPGLQQVAQPISQPASQQAVQPSSQQAPQGIKNQGTGKPAILVVEDEKDALDLYMYSIQSTGDFDVYGAMDGDEALMQLTQNKVDLVLLDIMMPKKDGVETLAELKKGTQLYGTPKIVMLTNIGGDIAIDKAMSLGADGYMLKSEVEPMELIGIIKQYLNIA
jgi:CheY-like chemotaxis protein